MKIVSLLLMLSLLFVSCMAQDDPIVEKRFEVHPRFLNDHSEQGDPEVGLTAQQIFEKNGVKFSEGTSASFDADQNILFVKNHQAQFTNVEFLLDQYKRSGEQMIYILSEWIEVDAAKFNQWIYENPIAADATDFRKEVQKWLKNDEADFFDLTMVSARSNSRSKSESAKEYIYPTEYDPSEIPAIIDLSDGAKAPMAPNTPTAFETRDLGFSLEVDPVIGGTLNQLIDLNIAVDHTGLKDFSLWPHAGIETGFRTDMPTFHTMSTVTQISLKDGVYSFLGTSTPMKSKRDARKKPIIIQFIRADIGSTTAWREM